MAVADELIALATRVIIQQVAGPYRAAFERRIGSVVICGVLAFIAGLMGVGCAAVAFWLWLAPMVGPALAGLICAVAFLLVALALGLAAARFARRTPSTVLGDMLKSPELGAAFDKHLPELLIAAAIGGLIIGARRRK